MQRSWPTLMLLVMVVLCLAAGPALAVSEGADKPPPGPHIFTPVRVDLGIWTLLVFLILFFLLKKYAWGPILEGLHKREDAIRSAVEEAKLARAETERERAKFQREMEEAFAKIPAMMDEARRDAQTMADEMRARAQADIQADRDRLRREIELAKDQALQQIWSQAATLATLISARTLKRDVSEEDHRRLIDEALKEMRGVRNGVRG
jgi:F-type H+-transporting ATPase subunit b